VPWKPTVEGEIPTLGWYAIDWFEQNLAAPALLEYQPFVLYQEQEDFILKWYALDPDSGRFLFDRGLLGRPRGWGKSPLLGALSCIEALGDVLFDGWDADGQPVGRPWNTRRTPLVQIAAVSEEQTGNTWQPMLEMLRTGDPPVLYNYPGLEPFDSVVNLPGGFGSIKQITSSARTTKGAPVTFAVLDQTEEWVSSNGGHSLAKAMRDNAAKNGGRTVESPNAFTPGEESVAEKSAEYAQGVAEGRVRVLPHGKILWDHREAGAETDLTDYDSLIAGLRVSYGDSSGHPDGCVLHDPPCAPGHQDLESIVSRIWDPDYDEQDARSNYLNQITHAKDAWTTRVDWNAAGEEARARGFNIPVRGDRAPQVLGFDGSQGRSKGRADATAFVAVDVRTGLAWAHSDWVWEQPEDWKPEFKGDVWQPDVAEVEAKLDEIMRDYNIVGFFADPSGWTSSVARWESKYGKRLKVKATPKNPIAMWPRGKTTDAAAAVENTRKAIENLELTHAGVGWLTRHCLNARRRVARQGYLLYKAYPSSPRKIDGAYALTMAWKCRLQAVSLGLGRPPRKDPPQKQKVLVLPR
jgi:hypothetical protein